MEMNERVWHLVKGELHFPLLGAGVRKAAERHGKSLKSFLALTRKELLTVPRPCSSICDMKPITLTLQRSEHQMHKASVQHRAGT